MSGGGVSEFSQHRQRNGEKQTAPARHPGAGTGEGLRGGWVGSALQTQRRHQAEDAMGPQEEGWERGCLVPKRVWVAQLFPEESRLSCS